MQQVAILLALLLLAYACSPERKASAALPTIRHHLKYRLQSLDPIESVDEASAIVLNVLHRRLYRLSTGGRVVGDLVVQEFLNRRGVELELAEAHFTDGSLVTASDVVFCFERLQNSGRQSWVLSGLKGTKALGPRRLFLQVQGGARTWQSLRSRLTLPKVSIYSKTQYVANGHFIGASPFTLRENSPERVVLESPARRVEFAVLPDEASRYFFFRRGQLDIYEADGVFRLMPADVGEYEARDTDGMAVLYGALVADGGLLNDRDFRLALNRAFDRQNFCDKTLLGGCVASEAAVPAQMGGGLPTVFMVQPLKYHKPLPRGYILTIRTPPDRERQNLARALRGLLAEAGVAVEILVLDLPTMIRHSNERRGGIYLFKWLVDYPHPENFLEPLFHSRNFGSGGNRAYYSNPEVDRLLDKTDYSPAQLRLIQNKIRDDAPWLFVGHMRKRHYLRRNAGFQGEMGLVLWDWKAYAGRSGNI